MLFQNGMDVYGWFITKNRPFSSSSSSSSSSMFSSSSSSILSLGLMCYYSAIFSYSTALSFLLLMPNRIESGRRMKNTHLPSRGWRRPTMDMTSQFNLINLYKFIWHFFLSCLYFLHSFLHHPHHPLGHHHQHHLLLDSLDHCNLVFLQLLNQWFSKCFIPFDYCCCISVLPVCLYIHFISNSDLLVSKMNCISCLAFNGHHVSFVKKIWQSWGTVQNAK